jgi:hypothetical protein
MRRGDVVGDFDIELEWTLEIGGVPGAAAALGCYLAERGIVRLRATRFGEISAVSDGIPP